MATGNEAPAQGYGPEMDAGAHETTYRSFIHFMEVAVIFCLSIVVGLAVGGIKHAWLSALFGIILAHIGAAIGLFAPNLSWRANLPFLILLLLMLVFY